MKRKEEHRLKVLQEESMIRDKFQTERNERAKKVKESKDKQIKDNHQSRVEVKSKTQENIENMHKFKNDGQSAKITETQVKIQEKRKKDELNKKKSVERKNMVKKEYQQKIN